MEVPPTHVHDRECAAVCVCVVSMEGGVAGRGGWEGVYRVAHSTVRLLV